MLIPLRDRDVGLALRDLADVLNVPPDQIVLTASGYSVPPLLAQAYSSTTGIGAVDTAPTPKPLATTTGPVCFTKPGVVDLCVYRGDSGRVRVRITDANGPVDVSAATWDCDFRATADDTNVLCSPTVEPVVGETNAVDVVITPDQSELLDADAVWDLEMTLGGQVTTVLTGKVLVTKDVSRA